MLDLLFETSWEVCNRVGGIYAVLSTKAKTLRAAYGDNVVFIGPDLWTDGKVCADFTPSRTPLSVWCRQARLPHGVTARVGRWNVPGKPLAVLVDYRQMYPSKNQIYTEMWNRFGVDSLHGYGDYDESCMFALAAAMVIESILHWKADPALRVVAHFDEWTTGMGLLYVKARLPRVATVFTTHATSTGRSISSNGKPLYDYMSGYHGDQMAKELNIQSKHSLEKTAVQQADAFTTVSEVTARECEQLLERRPLVTPNGFEQNFVPRGKAYTQARQCARGKLLQVAEALTGEHYGDDTLLVATSGRCEMRNKGIDVYLDALNVLRFKLQQLSPQHRQRRIVAFILVPGWTRDRRADLAANMEQGGKQRLFDPVITHSVHNPDSDAIYRKMIALGMCNESGDTVKVIYVPCYLNGNDGIFNMRYYDLLPGLDAAVFPSYYEPWGYTPLEAIAFKIPCITTDLAGFGLWVEGVVGRPALLEHCGVEVVHRTDYNFTEVCDAICNAVTRFSALNATEVKAVRASAAKLSEKALWSKFIRHYEEAYDVALRKNPL